MGVECWWNDTDSGKQKYWERNVIQRGWEVNEWVWNVGGMILAQENRNTGREPPLSVTLSSMNPLWTSLQLYPGISSQRSVTNCLSDGTAIRRERMRKKIEDLNINSWKSKLVNKMVLRMDKHRMDKWTNTEWTNGQTQNGQTLNLKEHFQHETKSTKSQREGERDQQGKSRLGRMSCRT